MVFSISCSRDTCSAVFGSADFGSADLSLRYIYLRYIYLRYIYLRYIYLRYIYLRYIYLRYIYLRVYPCYIYLRVYPCYIYLRYMWQIQMSVTNIGRKGQAHRLLTSEQFAGGIGGNATQGESAVIAEEILLARAMARGDNIVLPKLGKRIKTMRRIVDDLQANGYKVTLHRMDLPDEETMGRVVSRFNEPRPGRPPQFVDPKLVKGTQSEIAKVYDMLVEEGKIAEFGSWSNDVKFGEAPKWMGGSKGYRFKKAVTESISRTEARDAGRAGRDTQRGTGAGLEEPGLYAGADPRLRPGYGSRRVLGSDIRDPHQAAPRPGTGREGEDPRQGRDSDLAATRVIPRTILQPAIPNPLWKQTRLNGFRESASAHVRRNRG